MMKKITVYSVRFTRDVERAKRKSKALAFPSRGARKVKATGLAPCFAREKRAPLKRRGLPPRTFTAHVRTLFWYPLSSVSCTLSTGFTPSVNGDEVPRPSGDTGDSMPTCTVRTHHAPAEKIRSARNSVSAVHKYRFAHFSLHERTRGFSSLPSTAGFTLIETMVAVTILTVAVVAPMSLTMRSLSSAYYARDQIAAFHLAQAAIEAVRSVRDGNILRNALGNPIDLLNGISSVNGDPFTIDTRDNSMMLFSGVCPPLKTDGSLYGYGAGSGWATTRFTRSVRAQFVTGVDEVRVSVTISWRSGAFQARTFTISENLYRW